jgi:hypothetical protein
MNVVTAAGCGSEECAMDREAGVHVNVGTNGGNPY